MLEPRIIPCLLIHKGGLVKTVKFKQPKYVGDPLNAVRIFNEKKVDEIMVIDIDASVKEEEPNLKLIENLAAECQMPLCYGGGIKTIDSAQQIFQLGVEKISLSSVIFENKSLIRELSNSVGSQSVVVTLDIKKNFFGKRKIYIHNGKHQIKMELADCVKMIQDEGAGEIIINNIDNDGTMKGYDHELANYLKEKISIPLTIMGGAGSINDFKDVLRKHPIIGLAAGSFFVFKGKYKAVLISYQREKILENNYE
tara:strand:+ start:731 stop:1492 length:762 start_codon:yes stop_codon:yes gene_type:complete